MAVKSSQPIRWVIFSVLIQMIIIKESRGSSLANSQQPSVKQVTVPPTRSSTHTKGQQQPSQNDQKEKQVQQPVQQNDESNQIANQNAPSQTSTKLHENPEILKRRSDTVEEDQLPLATINNHSNRNNNQAAQLKPPQYVDVSALLGRNVSISSNSSPYSATNGNSLLSPKSRSGLPECATQQVCNAIFVRMNYTQRLCECSSNYNWKCSNNLDPQDGHTIELTRKFDKRIYTQIKTCEPLREVRACKSPTDWTLLALQSERSGKAHYVVVCKCPTWAQLEGPYTHNHPPYANIPGIRVYGMLCAHQTARSSAQTYSSHNPSLSIYPELPWSEVLGVLNSTNLASALDSE